MDLELREAMRSIFEGLVQLGAALTAVAMYFHLGSLSAVRPASATLARGVAALTTKLGSRLGINSPLLLLPEAQPVAKDRPDPRSPRAGMSSG